MLHSAFKSYQFGNCVFSVLAPIEIINLRDISASNFNFGGFSEKLFDGQLPFMSSSIH